MADMAPLFRERLQTLQEGMATLETELEAQSKAAVVDQDALQRLAEVSGDFWQQADTLLDMMLDQGAEPLLFTETATLVEYFEDTAERLERLARAGRG
jgi:hypothetical protein